VTETQSRRKTTDEKFLDLDMCLQKSLQEKSELVKEVEQLRTQLKKSVVEIEQLRKAVSDKDQVKCTQFESWLRVILDLLTAGI
jgi:hypothetical protein